VNNQFAKIWFVGLQNKASKQNDSSKTLLCCQFEVVNGKKVMHFGTFAVCLKKQKQNHKQKFMH